MAERVKTASPTLGTADLAKVRITLRKSLIGRPAGQRRTAHALGLRRVGASRVHAQTSSFTGAARKIEHLVSVEEVDDGRAG
jgi:large subunit ribosomal protein L30